MKKRLYCVLGNGEMEKGETPQTSECQRHLKLQKRHLKYIETPPEKKDPRLG
jgi:transketolase N-terminal domain/subunit